MAVTAKMVKELRDMTGAGMMDCKKALVETDGNIDAAVDLLKEKGLAKAAKKAGRIAAMGLVKTAVAADEKAAAIVEVNSETDFVAKNDEFVGFVETLAQMALENDAADMEAFMALPYGEEGTVQEVLTSKIATIGENMSIRRFEKVAGETVVSYIHGGRIGAIVAGNVEASEEVKTALTNVAMQVAAMNPQYVSRDEISADELTKMHDITLESALNDPFTLPKPILNALLDKAVDGVWSEEDTAILAEKRADKANIADNKIFTGLVAGRVSKQLKDICLMDQTYVRAEDGKQTVAQYLGTVNKDLALVKVVRFEVGEGIEKKEEDFAAEVAAQQAAAAAK